MRDPLSDTLFHVGSISKSFTALAVLKAADKGLVALDCWQHTGIRGESSNRKALPQKSEITVGSGQYHSAVARG